VPACLGCTCIGVSEAVLIPAVVLWLFIGCVCVSAFEAVPALLDCSALLTAAAPDAGLCATCCAVGVWFGAVPSCCAAESDAWWAEGRNNFMSAAEPAASPAANRRLQTCVTVSNFNIREAGLSHTPFWQNGEGVIM
jgi:hypothetical protein